VRPPTEGGRIPGFDSTGSEGHFSCEHIAALQAEGFWQYIEWYLNVAPALRSKKAEVSVKIRTPGDGDSAMEVRGLLIVIKGRNFNLKKKDVIETEKTMGLDGAVLRGREHFVSEAFGHAD